MSVRPSAVQRLVDRIKADFEDRNWAGGDLIGAEKELCAAYGVSPSVLRQAARVLEASGLARMRPGNGGGLIAQGVSVRGAASLVATYFQSIGLLAADMRVLLPPLTNLAAYAAIDRITASDAEVLRGAVGDYRATDDAFEKGIRRGEIFQTIGDVSHNPILALAQRALIDFLGSVTPFDDPGVWAVLLAAPLPTVPARHLVEALIAGDVLEVSSMLARHHARAEAIANLRAAVDGGRLDAAPVETGSERTRAAKLARLILHDISRGRQPGERLGDQPELTRRFGVSRNTYRQAVRLLEQYGAVEGRPGKGGGLFVATPNPDRVTETAYFAWRRAGATAADRSAVLRVLLAQALDQALKHDGVRLVQRAKSVRLATPPDVASLTDAVLDLGASRPLAFLHRLVDDFRPADGGGEAPPGGATGALSAFIGALERDDRPVAHRALADLLR